MMSPSGSFAQDQTVNGDLNVVEDLWLGNSQTRFLGSYGGNGGFWAINPSGKFTFGLQHNWDYSFDLFLSPSVGGGLAEIGQRVKNSSDYALQTIRFRNADIHVADGRGLYADSFLSVGDSTPRAYLDVAKQAQAGDLTSALGRLSEGDYSGDGTYLGVRAYATQGDWSVGIKSFSLEHRFYGQLNSSIDFYRGGNTTGGHIRFTTSNGTERMRIDNQGRVGIGTDSAAHKLEVNGTIRAKEIIVEALPWPDYVFEDGYALPSLEETRQHILQHKRLPGMPSAEDVAEKGLTVGENQRLLLQKIEELTLHVIALEERLDEKDRQLAGLLNVEKGD